MMDKVDGWWLMVVEKIRDKVPKSLMSQLPLLLVHNAVYKTRKRLMIKNCFCRFFWFCFTIPIDLMSPVYLFNFIIIFVVYFTWTLTERLPLRKVVSWMSEERRRGRIQETLKFAMLRPMNFQKTLRYLVSTMKLLWHISLPNEIIFIGLL